MDGFWQNTLYYHSNEGCFFQIRKGTHRKVGLKSFSDLERDANNAVSDIRLLVKDSRPWIEKFSLEISSSCTHKNNPRGQLYIRSDNHLVINFIVRGSVALTPVRWQCSGESLLEKLNRDFKSSIHSEIQAAILGTHLTQRLRCPVIFDPWLACQLIHECIGHTSEADNFFSYAYPKGFDLGYTWCSYPINVFDDSSLPEHRGSYTYDDDGELSRCAKLVSDGQWTDLLVSSEYKKKLGIQAGHGRRVVYARHCLPRMCNTWLQSGKETLRELISTVDYGLFCGGTWGGGSLGTNFILRPAYGIWIESGKLTNRFVRRFDILGNKFETIRNIIGVSDHVSWFSPVYGCDKFGQNNLPVTMGSPHILLESVDISPIL